MARGDVTLPHRRVEAVDVDVPELARDWVRLSADMSRCSGSFCWRIALATASLPRSIASSRRSLENHWRILLRARALLTNWSQSREGPAPSALEVSS